MGPTPRQTQRRRRRISRDGRESISPTTEVCVPVGSRRSGHQGTSAKPSSSRPEAKSRRLPSLLRHSAKSPRTGGALEVWKWIPPPHRQEGQMKSGFCKVSKKKHAGRQTESLKLNLCPKPFPGLSRKTECKNEKKTSNTTYSERETSLAKKKKIMSEPPKC